jgi:hypothetical protein
MDLFAPVLALIGGGAIGAAIGGAVLAAQDWSGARFRAGLAIAFCLGAGLGYLVVAGPPSLDFAHFLPRLGPPSASEETERVLKTYYPDDYAAAKSTVDTLKATGASDAQTQSALRKVALSLMQRQMPLASTENALAYLDVAKDEQALLSKNPDLCYQVVMQPTPDALDQLQAALPDDLKKREASLALKLLEQTATAPQPARMTADLDSKIQIWTRDAVWGLSFDERDALQSGGALRSKAGCEVVGNYLRMLSMIGGTDAAEAYKSLSEKGLQRVNEQTPSYGSSFPAAPAT